MSRAAEWGLAALVIGLAISLAAPVVAVLATEVWAYANRDPNIVLLHAWLARLAVAMGMLLSLFAIAWGVKGMLIVENDRPTSGLAVGGLVLSSVAMVAWIIASVELLSTTESLLRLYG
ncbi:MAG TPA: hypothetical protein VGJ15_00270 [Pirellulales bacterium]|jgi:hypothetical protein